MGSTYTVAADPSGMACTVTSTDAAHGFQLVTTYITDPASDTVLMRTGLRDAPGSDTNLAGLHLYARLDAHVNGNGGGGSDNAAATPAWSIPRQARRSRWCSARTRSPTPSTGTTRCPPSWPWPPYEAFTGLTAAAAIAARHGDAAWASLYQATADDFQRNIKSWTVTTDGPYAPAYFIRLSKTGDPTASGATGYAQVGVTNEGGGSTVLDVADSSGDDNGPGTYQYPTDSDFAAGSFDLTRFQVLSDGTYAYLRVTLRTLVPTFGVLDGAQLLDVYVHAPNASSTSTQSAFGSRDYTIAQAGAWTQRLEAQGFASPVWVDASGKTVGAASVLAEQPDRTITIAVPEAQFGTPASGWGFAVVLTGQNGFSFD